MKKVAILVASVLVLGSFSTRALAAGTDTQTVKSEETPISFKDEAGITPDSLLYTIDQAVDKLRVMLAGSEEKKTEIIADIATERLGESEVMTEEGKTELAEKAIEEYNEKITEAIDKLKEVVNDAEIVKEENTDEKLQQSVEDLTKAIQNVQDKSLEVLNNLQGKISDEAADVVDKVVEEQSAKKVAVANFVKERHEFNAVKKALNMAKVEVKKLEKSGDEEAIKKAQEELTKNQQAYMTAKTELQAAFSAKQAVVKGETKTEEPSTTVEQNNSAVETAAGAETKDSNVISADQNTTTTQTTGYVKTNNGNGNGNSSKEKSVKVDKEDDKNEKQDKENKKEDKSAPGKSAEEHGKSNQSNGKNK